MILKLLLFSTILSVNIFVVFNQISSRTVYGEKSSDYSKKLSHSLSTKGVNAIHLSIHSGDINITGTQGDNLNIVINKRVTGLSTEDAQAAFSILNFGVSQEGKIITLRTRLDGDYKQINRINKLLSQKDFVTDIELQVPEQLELECSAIYGNISIYNFSSKLTVSTMNGTIKTQDIKSMTKIYSIKGDYIGLNITGSVVAKLYDGEVKISKVVGDILASNNNGTILINDAVGNVNVNSMSGRINLSKIQGKVLSRSVKGQIVIDTAIGSLDLESEKGSIETRNIMLGEEDFLRIISTDGNLSARISETISGNLQATTQNGIIINDFEVKTSTGALISSKQPRSKLVGMLNFEKNGKNDVFLKTVSGDITLRKQKVH